LITIELPFPPSVLSPNARPGKYKKASAVKEAKELGYYLTLESFSRDENTVVVGSNWKVDRIRATYIFCAPDSRRRDLDNILASCKAYQDGVCRALGIDDRIIRNIVIKWGEKVKDGQVILKLEELQE